jgi:predicted RNase H-like nuclease (RuvC/YqgF family)
MEPTRTNGRIRSATAALLVTGLTVAAVGCTDSHAEQNARRDRDRAAIQLVDAQKKADEQAALATQLQADVKKLQADLATANGQLKVAQEQLAAARASAGDAAKQRDELKAAQDRAAAAEGRVSALQQQVDQLKAAQAAARPAPSTRPTAPASRPLEMDK